MSKGDIVEIAYIRCLKMVSVSVWCQCIDESSAITQSDEYIMCTGDRGMIQQSRTQKNSETSLYWFQRYGKSIVPLGVGTSSIEKVLKKLEAQGYVAFESEKENG